MGGGIEMELGAGIAIAGVCVPAAAVIMTAIRSKPNGKGNSSTPTFCPAHSGIQEILNALKSGQNDIKNDIRSIFTLLERRKVPRD